MLQHNLKRTEQVTTNQTVIITIHHNMT